ncbi:uncharacterized protein BDR25DRAFT_347860 [Lindgomyces ingoldianus]|uniref:Uncharacterized protein n=1 Tax=Lindgomyces ingoldianus TaxID=673940 RepID=A0ACB6RED7_9PLEO|nr:uncharacterized protein BDR25DRAFT_347860 [Lindgomyces ingoldianus]KAF2477506.1 hypothetical protein BDR25DRAFT_347860 [Lindgomyces ingoldianus]
MFLTSPIHRCFMDPVFWTPDLFKRIIAELTRVGLDKVHNHKTTKYTGIEGLDFCHSSEVLKADPGVLEKRRCLWWRNLKTFMPLVVFSYGINSGKAAFELCFKRSLVLNPKHGEIVEHWEGLEAAKGDRRYTRSFYKMSQRRQTQVCLRSLVETGNGNTKSARDVEPIASYALGSKIISILIIAVEDTVVYRRYGVTLPRECNLCIKKESQKEFRGRIRVAQLW